MRLLTIAGALRRTRTHDNTVIWRYGHYTRYIRSLYVGKKNVPPPGTSRTTYFARCFQLSNAFLSIVVRENLSRGEARFFSTEERGVCVFSEIHIRGCVFFFLRPFPPVLDAKWDAAPPSFPLLPPQTGGM